MAWLAIGVGGLLLGLWLLRLFATARIETIKKAATWTLGVLGGLLLIGMLATGRGGQAIWTLFLFGPMAWRWWQGRRAARRFGRAEGAPEDGAAGSGDAAGDSSAVDTATLAMRLHHGSGRMTGRVRRGAFDGRDLSELGLPELLALLAECRTADTESVPLLEAWLDRVEPAWREAGHQSAGAAPSSGGPMTREEALAVLGLSEGVAEEAIRAAHRRLMRAAHPDQGGSDWLAARINQARDILLP